MPSRYMYLLGQQVSLLAKQVHVAAWPAGEPGRRASTFICSASRLSRWPSRYMYLFGEQAHPLAGRYIPVGEQVSLLAKQVPVPAWPAG